MTQHTQPRQEVDDSASRLVAPSWYVLWTRSHAEQLVHDQLAGKGFQPFLPMMDVWCRRKGLRHHVRMPMFPGYLFLHHAMDKNGYHQDVETTGLVKVLGDGWDRPAVVPDVEVEAIRKLHTSRLPARPHVYLRDGERVRITDGLLAGAEGILIRSKPNKGLLVISIDLLQRSVAVEIDCTLVVAA